MLRYTFRKAKTSDRSAVIDFMNKNWGSEHPLVNNSRLCDYYFCHNGDFNFALCIADDKDSVANSGEIASVAGYIYANKQKTAAYVSIWCADKAYNGAGLELMERLKDITGVSVLCCNNIRPNTLKFYEFLGYTAGKFTHAYMLDDRDKYEIASITNKNITQPKAGDAAIIEINDINEVDLLNLTNNLAIKKDIYYLKFRYMEYPFRNYRFFAIKAQETIGIFVLRLTNVNNATAVRIVDYIGDPVNILKAGVGLKQLLITLDAEYIDFYCVGIDNDILQGAGFNIRDEDDKNIIPNYTEPLDLSNIDFYYFTSKTNGFTMFRADGDGDRPILI